MSGFEPATAASSSSPPSNQESDPTPASSSYAFLVHSQKTLTENLPPRVDNKLLARQKRRRTSPEDHAILESEYQRNPKPDKAARASIVSRVSLGGKEVQIWFQNRRQNDRRKSRPLQPHELLAPLSEELKPSTSVGSPLAMSDSSNGLEPDNSCGINHGQQGLNLSEAGSFVVDGRYNDEPDPLGASSQTSVATSEPGSSQQVPNDGVVELDSLQDLGHTSNHELQNSAKRKRSGSDLPGGRTIPAGSTTPSLNTFKSPPALRISLSFDGEAMVRKEGELTPSPPKGRNSLRISMSADGKAVVRANGEPSPSKNRISMFSARRPRLSTLRRSNSAVVLGTPRCSLEKERSFGRSRDPRNWESFFDTDARSALSTPFSSQSTPNAAPGVSRPGGQRSLTRSLSARHVSLLTPNPLENQSTPISQAMQKKRRKLSRTVSSLGRLESHCKALGDKTYVSAKMSKNSKVGENLDLEGGDSDKENWVPGTRVPHARRRTNSHHHPQRPVLKESNARSGQSYNNTLASAGRSRLAQGANRKPGGGSTKSMSGLDPGVSALITSGSTASHKEDLDCIQGLLSLSQGAWR
ncbi:homeobox domain-containing protein [Aspergillus lucknowensis]|uniref:Homeobox domain-containing protein n=1 Tax=Aspergillus lucknowensis TaxID=176173 RepID=A0ABR4LV30_9EURO